MEITLRSDAAAALQAIGLAAADKGRPSIEQVAIRLDAEGRMSLEASDSYILARRSIDLGSLVNGIEPYGIRVSARHLIRALQLARGRRKTEGVTVRFEDRYLAVAIDSGRAWYEVGAAEVDMPDLESIAAGALEGVRSALPQPYMSLTPALLQKLTSAIQAGPLRLYPTAQEGKGWSPYVAVPIGVDPETVVKGEVDRWGLIMPVAG